jgi:serine/threonine protein kinase
MTYNIGTETYASPEQLSKSDYNEKTDIYSLGIIYYELLNHFDTQMERIMSITKVRELDGQLLGEFRDVYPDECELIERMIDHDVEERLNINQVRKQFLRLHGVKIEKDVDMIH